MGLDCRIIIVGAGVGGLYAVGALQDKGYKNITILEKEPFIGGKCKTIEYDGVHYDLGANLTTPRYRIIRNLAIELGVESRPVAPRNVVSVDGSTIPQPNWLERIGIRILQQYYNLLWRLSGVSEPGYACQRESLMVSFEIWLSKNGLGMLTEMFSILFVSYGYGYIMQLPAIYALKFFDPIHLDAAIDVILGNAVPDTTEFVNGFQYLWERFAEDRKLNIKTATTVHLIDRSGLNIKLFTSSGTYTCDKLIMACPPRTCLHTLDLSIWYRRLLMKVDSYAYHVTLAKIEGLKPEAYYIAPYATKVTPGWPTVLYPVGQNEDGIFTCYAYGGDHISPPTVRTNLETTVAKLGGEVKEYLYEQAWTYFPHVDVNDAKNDFYEHLDHMQGNLNTYFVGEMLAFTLTELIAEHAAEIIAEHF